ncbi:MAG TPA: LysR family transcriptional regulator [Terriglobales bacterium]|nr:LysR family transcriptional regulator [Terriglobales bacterium]
MDFDQLVTFIEVAKLRNFSRAGQKVFRSQSAVSAQIRQLEHEYGERLLDRSGKNVSLTAAGEVFLEYAQRFVRLRTESLQAVASQSDKPRGVLVVGANEATCLYVLPEVFGNYSKEYPQVQVSIYRNFSRKILERVEDGTVDLGVVSLPVKSPNLKVHPIFRDRIMCMVSARNPLSNKTEVGVRELSEQPLIFPKTGSTRQLFDSIFRPYRGKLRVAMEIPSVSMIKRFVAADVGVSLVTASYAADQVRSGEAKLLALKGLNLYRELGLVHRSDKTLSPAAVAFIELCRQRAAEQNTGSPKK